MSAGSLLEAYDVLLLDLDGTVYHGREPVGGAVDGIAAARRAGVKVRYVTNNASKAPESVARQLCELGVPAETAEVATSAQAGARLLASLVDPGTDVLVVGTDALAAEVEAAGLRVPATRRSEVGAVIQGHSPETAWPDLAEACLAIRSGAVWVACNVDATLPTERGQLPGNGSMVAALRTATGQAPAVAGKPEPALFQQASRQAGAQRSLVVGDRLDTDIAGAVAAGMDSLLVLSGVTTAAGVLAAAEGQRPDFIGTNLASAGEDLAALSVGEQPQWSVEVADGVLRVTGSGEPIALLRALCPVAWRTGISAVTGGDTTAAEALRALGLVADPLPLSAWNR